MRRFPKEREGQGDHVWMPDFLVAGATVLTTDFTILEDLPSRKVIPDKTCGLIVVRPDHPRRDFDSMAALGMIAAFKSAYPEWDAIEWDDLYVEIRDSYVQLRHIQGDPFADGEVVLYCEEKFCERLGQVIAKLRSPQPQIENGVT
ncbi:MAG TPA: hypothetical protein VHY79_04775 [Rhizomicrobium sp.]|nr:hypothetical protein [Rhizomicrobium sp.]